MKMIASPLPDFLFAIQRFPKPEFESGYVEPQTWLPLPRAEWLAWLDVTVLIAALSLAAWLALKKRSRLGVMLLSLFSLAWFGFYREGCVCPIGAIQNVALGLTNPLYSVPLVVLIFFLAPLIFTLLFGRGFCAAVCPFGALQDLVAFRPIRLSTSLNAFLGLIPFLYLGLAVLLAVTASDFIICRYDPFVGIFRMNASFSMLFFAGLLLLAGVFIARPYCRFLCPYGVLLNWMSRLSWKHMTITPAECIRCRLCENSCPYDAIDVPHDKPIPVGRKEQRKRFYLLLGLLPLLILLFGWAGGQIHETLAGTNHTVRIATMITDNAASRILPEPPEITAFKSSRVPVETLMAEASAIRQQFLYGSRIFGGFIGLMLGLTLIGLLRTPYRKDYLPDRGRCFSCARCMDYCPVGETGAMPAPPVVNKHSS